MADFHALALQRGSDGAPGWLTDFNDSGRATWKASMLPGRKTEAWRYTPMRALERGDWLGEAKSSHATQRELAELFRIDGLDATTLVFVNGHYSAALSSTQLPDDVVLVRFSEAEAKEAREIRAHLGTVVDSSHHPFAALNDSWLVDGVFLKVARHAHIETPIQVVWLTLPQEEGFAVSQRLLVVMEEGSEATVVEHFASDENKQSAFTNGVTELIVGRAARLYHYRLHLEEEHALHIGGLHANLERNAVLESFHMGLGGTLKRVDVVVNHRGEGAECRLDGLYLPRNDQLIDYHTNIEHWVPRCTTSETFRGIVADRARAVFNGRIHIHPDAQKTRAELSNRNLLTSDQAEVDTKPELEIYADDVQCAHGATVAQLDEASIYYLVSRGIARAEAEVMLSFGFIVELVDRLHHAPLAAYLRPKMSVMFGRDRTLARHIAA